MLMGDDGKMRWQDGERVDKDVDFVVEGLDKLLLGAVFLTEETGALQEGFTVHLRPCGHDAGWVPLHRECHGVLVEWQLTGLDVVQVTVSLAGVGPPLQLAVEKTFE